MSSSAAGCLKVGVPRSIQIMETLSPSGLHTKATTPFIIGLCGPPSSGKTEACNIIREKLDASNTTPNNRQRCGELLILNMENFYKNLTESEEIEANQGLYNFDHPLAMDFELLNSVMTKIVQHEKHISIPSEYDYKNHRRGSEDITVTQPISVVIVCGVLAFYDPCLLEKFSLKLFVEMDSDTRLQRRIQKDHTEHARPLNTVIKQYLNLVKPSYEEFCVPTKKFADIIIPRGHTNVNALETIAEHIQRVFKDASHVGGVGATPPSTSRGNSCRQ